MISTIQRLSNPLCYFFGEKFPASILRSNIIMVSPYSTSFSSDGESGAAYTVIKERVTVQKEVKSSKFIAIAGPVCNEESAFSFLSEVRDPRATHNCWAYKIGSQCRSNDDGEPSGTAGKPIQSVIDSSGLDRVMIIVIRYFGGIKLGTGGLVRAYRGIALECLRNASTMVVKPMMSVGVEVSFDSVGILNHLVLSSGVSGIKHDYETGKDGFVIVSFKVEIDKFQKLEDSIKSSISRELVFYR